HTFQDNCNQISWIGAAQRSVALQTGIKGHWLACTIIHVAASTMLLVETWGRVGIFNIFGFQTMALELFRLETRGFDDNRVPSDQLCVDSGVEYRIFLLIIGDWRHCFQVARYRHAVTIAEELQA